MVPIPNLQLPVLDDQSFLAVLIKQEAEGEPFEGKVAVSFVVVNRARKYRRSIKDVILDPYDFSCWNTNSLTRMRIDDISSSMWYDCQKAAAASLYELSKDPTSGAVYYINPKISNPPPSWWNTDTDPTSEVKIGKHVFRRKKT